MARFFLVTDSLPRRLHACGCQRDGHHPGMALHTALVAFGYGKSQRIVAGVAAHLSGQYGVVGLDG